MLKRIGQQLGNYRLLRLLGVGGFAEVYLGQHIHLQTQAAIKVLHAHMGSSEVERFYAEARTIAGLVHPHILRILDLGVQEGLPYLVMDYAPKGTVRQLHPPGTQLPLVTVVSYVRQVAEALQFAHDAQVIHRDVKPENLLVGHRRSLLLSDFGLAVFVGLPSPEQAEGGPAVVGSVGYLAPEQFLGQPCAASDQYALGIVAYEWFIGDLPFIGTPDEVVDQHLSVPPPSLRERAPDLPPVVEQVVSTALAKDPAARYPSVWDFAIALEQAATSGETTALPHSPASLVGRRSALSLVGRSRELTELRHLLRRFERLAHRGLSSHLLAAPASDEAPRSPHIAALLGEAGIGKTRLAEELSQDARQRGWLVAWSRGYEQESSIPYGLWREVLRAAIAQSGWQGQELENFPNAYQALVTLLPEVADWLPLPTVSLSSPSEQRWVWEAVFLCLTAIAERTPLLLVIDDVQWADSSSRDLLAYLARRLKQERVLLVGTCRDTELEPTHPLLLLLHLLQREQTALLLPVGPLDAHDIGLLLARLPGPLSTPLIERIQSQAAGNPLFAEELARLTASEEQQTETIGPGQKLTRSTLASTPSPDAEQPRPSLPDTIAAVLDLRLAALSPACQRLLGKASVMGGSFDLSLMRLMVRDASTPSNEDALLDALDEALRARVLTEESAEGRITYRFWHPLLVSHLYERLSAGRRAFLHRRAADALQTVYTGHEEEGAASITYHLVRGRADRQRIASFAELAGDAAYLLSAYPEAERYYRLALDQCDEMTDSSLSESVTERLHLASLAERLGECLRFQGNEEESRRLYHRVLEVRPPLDEITSEVERQRESELQALLRCAIGQTWYNAGNDQQAEECFEQGELVLRQVGVVAGPALAGLRFEQGYLYWREGKYEEAHRVALEALALFEEALAGKPSGTDQPAPSTRIRRTLAGDPVDLGRAQVLLGNIAHTVGHPADALVHWKTALAVFELHHCLREIAIVSCNLGDIYLRRAEHALARESFRRSLELVERVGDIPLQAVVFCNLAILAARGGELAEAESAYKQSLELAERSNALAYVSAWLAYLAASLLDQGKQAESAATLRRALSLSRSLNHAPSYGLALIILGQVRMWQAKQVFSENDSSRLRLLLRARGSLQRAFACQGLEAEVSTEGKIALAEVALLLGELDEAYQTALATLEAARAAELATLIARSERLLGGILAARGQYEQGDQHFEQALRLFNESAMRLEYARTLHHYGAALVRRSKRGEADYQLGVRYLREARQVFVACRALPDMQIVERILANIPDDAVPQYTS